MVDHLVYNNTNEYLQNAPPLTKYGLENFTFAVVEFCDIEVLLQLEQYYLDILFPPSLCSGVEGGLFTSYSPLMGSSLGGALLREEDKKRRVKDS